MEKNPSTTGKAHESRKWGLPGFPVVLMESLISYLPTLMLCLHARERYKNSSLYSITSTVAPHAEYNKNHILVSIDLSLKAQNQNFRKTTPNPRGSHQGKAAWHPLAEKHCLKVKQQTFLHNKILCYGCITLRKLSTNSSGFSDSFPLCLSHGDWGKKNEFYFL